MLLRYLIPLLAFAAITCAVVLAPAVAGAAAADRSMQLQAVQRPGQSQTQRPPPVQAQRPPQAQQASPGGGAHALELVRGRAVARPGAQSTGVLQKQSVAESLRASVATVQEAQRSGSGIRTLAEQPGIHKLNGRGSGVFEPGGRYAIGGREFGTVRGTVTLRSRELGRPVDLNVLDWQDGYILVEMASDISEVPDVRNVELTVAIPGKASMTSNRFGFRAMRETVALKEIPQAAIQTSGQSPRIDRTRAGSGIRVWRNVEDTRDGKRCFDPARDRVHAGRIALKPGFEIESAQVSPMRLRTQERDGINETAFGKFDWRWEGLDLVVDWGVQRTYNNRLLAVGGQGNCTSTYEVEVYVSGPRGLPPQ